LASKKRGKKTEDANAPTVIQGQPVQVGHTSEYIDLLKQDNAEKALEIAELTSRLHKAHAALSAANIPIPQ
jgi:hypothetical protein